MELVNPSEMKVISYGLGAILGIVGAAYLNPALSNNILQLIAGVVLVFVAAMVIKGSDHVEGAVRIGIGAAGALFVIRGLLGFVPTVKAQLTSATLGVI